MLLTVSLRPEKPAGRSRKRARHERVEPGSIVQGTVLDVHPLHVDVQLSDGGALQMLRVLHNTLDQKTCHLRHVGEGEATGV